MGGLGGLAGLGNLGMGSANFMEMQQRMQRDLLANPDMLRQVLDNPLTQSLMTNPDVIRQMLESNPQMQVNIYSDFALWPSVPMVPLFPLTIGPFCIWFL